MTARDRLEPWRPPPGYSPSVPPPTQGGKGSYSLVTRSRWPRDPSKPYHAGTIGSPLRLWQLALGLFGLKIGEFKIVETRRNGLYLARELSEAEYEALEED